VIITRGKPGELGGAAKKVFGAGTPIAYGISIGGEPHDPYKSENDGTVQILDTPNAFWYLNSQ